VPAAAAVAEDVAQACAQWAGKPIVLDPRAGAADDAAQTKRAAFRAADAALAASGTVSLELAASGTPMVIAYRMAWLSQKIISAMALIDTATLVNIVSDTREVPEFLADRCRSDLIAPALLDILAHPGGQVDAMELTMKRLGRGGEEPGLRAARAVLKRLGE
jgi:lipid-A-disaccharide synthase